MYLINVIKGIYNGTWRIRRFRINDQEMKLYICHTVKLIFPINTEATRHLRPKYYTQFVITHTHTHAWVMRLPQGQDTSHLCDLMLSSCCDCSPVANHVAFFFSQTMQQREDVIFAHKSATWWSPGETLKQPSSIMICTVPRLYPEY